MRIIHFPSHLSDDGHDNDGSDRMTDKRCDNKDQRRENDEDREESHS